VAGGQNTLRITVEEQPEGTTLKLAGRVAGPWLREISEVWQKLLPSLRMRALVVDLRDVTFADAEGTRLLRTIYRESGGRFLANTPMTKHLAEEAMDELDERTP
jgi:anti-anti-sigma regulatory factor